MDDSTVATFRDTIFQMRDKGWLVDVTLACGGQLFYAHKLILSASSEYFKEMFAALPNQQYPIVFLKGVSQELLMLALEFMYCGLVDIPEEKVRSFITLANEFRIKGLNSRKSPETEIPIVKVKEEISEELSVLDPPAKRMKMTPIKSEKQTAASDENNSRAIDEKIQPWEMFAVKLIEHLGKYNPLTINQVRTILEAAAKRSGKETTGRYNLHADAKWWYELTTKFPSIIKYVKKEGLTESLQQLPTTKLFLEPFIEILDKYKLNKNPEFIWSCEEITISAKKSLKRETIAYPARIRDHTSTNSVPNNGNSMSILCSISPSGRATSSFFVVKNEVSNNEELSKGNIIYASNSSGTVDKDILLQWFTDIFLAQCPKKRSKSKPVILLVDSQFYNITETLLNLAYEEHVMLLPLIPHIPVACQPFDLVLFNSIRPGIETEFSELNEKKRLRKSVPSSEPINTVKAVMDRHLTIDVIKDGFNKCGIYPSNLNSFIKCNQDRVGFT